MESRSLKITTKEIKEYIIKNEDELNSNIKNIRENIKLQREEELILFENRTSICSIRQLSELREHLGSLNLDEYKNLLDNNFYDSRVMLASMCVANSFLYTLPGDMLSSNKRIRQWLSKVKKLGQPSVEGMAMLANLKNLENLFVLKAPNEAMRPLIHEWVVGALGLNPLRAYVPNFAYIMGAFNCSKPIDTNTTPYQKNDIVMCMDTPVLTNDDVAYIVYEKIEGISMADYIRECTFEQFLDKYLQILYALALANEKCNFTHYDLHSNNVIIRNIYPTSPVAIPYMTERGEKEYLITDGVATLIDYGYSHVTLEEEEYGYHELPQYGIMANAKFPLHDAYKLLCNCMIRMLNAYNRKCYYKCQGLLRYFNDTENLDNIIYDQKDTYYMLPYTAELKDISIFDFTRYLRVNIPEINNIMKTRENVMESGIKILEPTDSEFYFYTIGRGNKIRELKPIYNKLGLDQEYVVNDIFDFYDIISQLQEKDLVEGLSGDNAEKIEFFTNNFRDKYHEIKVSYLENINNELAKIRTEVDKLNIIRVKSFDPFRLKLTKESLQYMNNFYSILYIMDRLQRIVDIKNALEFTVNIYQDEIMIEYILEINDRIRFLINGQEREDLKIIGFKEIIQWIIEDLRYIKEVVDNVSMVSKRNLTGVKDKIHWYFRDFLEFLDILISLLRYLNFL